MKDNDVCGSLMRRLSDENHFARKAKWEQRGRAKAERQTGRILLNVAAVRRESAARCVVEFKQSLTRSCEQRVVVRSWRMKSERQPLRRQYLFKAEHRRGQRLCLDRILNVP